MQKLADGIYMQADPQGVTVGAVLTDRGAVAVDTPTAPGEARKWRLRLAQLSPLPIACVVNLDHHRDRVLGNQWFEAPVIAHEATAEHLRTYPEQFRPLPPEWGADSEMAGELMGVKLVPPQVTFSQELILEKGPRTVLVEHHGGNSPGAAWVHLPEAKVLFLGDLLTVGVPPFLAEADVGRWLELLAELKKARFRGYTFVPGRGPATDQGALKDMIGFLNTVLRKVRRFHASGRSRADLGTLVPDLLAAFDVPGNLRELHARRLRFGLEHVYDLAEKEAKG